MAVSGCLVIEASACQPRNHGFEPYSGHDHVSLYMTVSVGSVMSHAAAYISFNHIWNAGKNNLTTVTNNNNNNNTFYWPSMNRLNQTGPATFSIMPCWAFSRDSYFLYFAVQLSCIIKVFTINCFDYARIYRNAKTI
jgi:hypothetical protein